MNFKARYQTDKDAESEGVWEDIGEGFRVKVARSNNPHHQRVAENLMRPYRRQIANGSLSNDKMTEITVKAMSEALLLDWEGLEIDDKPVPYSREMAHKLLTEYKDFREEVAELAQSIELFRSSEIEEAEKNSSRASSGKGSGKTT
tara:strand:- start:2383 stop:2820 length:438 start_codon:yes stop_codon:yes gene_type:complete